jgi:synaptobrevin family protein YKT6
MDEFRTRYPTTPDAATDNTVSFPVLDEYLKTYQDPNQVSSISKIQQELDETKIVLHKTIQSVRLASSPLSVLSATGRRTRR